MVYLHHMLIVLFILHTVASFPFYFSMAVFIFRSGSSVHRLCVEIILMFKTEYSKSASCHTFSCAQTPKVLFKHLVPWQKALKDCEKRLLCSTSHFYMTSDGSGELFFIRK